MKNASLKEAKFFCESCGAEVPRNSKVCTTCGKFFAAVRCPKCGKTGNTDDFKNGCPSCGYAVHVDYAGSTKNIKINNKSKFRLLSNTSSNTYKNKNIKGQDERLPVWIYISCIVVLIILVLMLYSCL